MYPRKKKALARVQRAYEKNKDCCVLPHGLKVNKPGNGFIPMIL